MSLKPRQRAHSETENLALVQTATVAEAASSTAGGPPIMDKVGNGALYGAAAFFGATFMISVVRYFQKYNRSENKSRRKVRCPSLGKKTISP